MTADATAPDEQVLGWFTEWYRPTPTALEFWEGLVTDRRLVWCRVGESFRSLLLRTDMGARNRESIRELSPAELAADEGNVVVPLSALRSVRLRTGGLLRRARLTVTWKDDGREELALHNTSDGDAQASFVERLAADDRFDHVECTVE